MIVEDEEFFFMVLPADEGKMIMDEEYEPEEGELEDDVVILQGNRGRIVGCRIINSGT